MIRRKFITLLSGAAQAVARTLGLQSHVLYASAVADFDTVFATLADCEQARL
jgi:hypothetical protein